MNDQTAKLLEQLAGKLGTTSEYLWGVLLKQAPVSATITLIQTMLIFAAGFGLLKLHRYLLNDNNAVSYDGSDDFIAVPMFVLAVLWLVLVTVAFFSIDDVINGYFNREFWALDYILNKLKSK